MKKRIMALAMSVLLITGLAACNVSETGKNTQEDTFVYVAEYLPIPKDFASGEGENTGINANIISLKGNILYYQKWEADAEGNYGSGLYSLDLLAEGAEAQPLNVHFGENRTPQKTLIDDAGNIYAVVSAYGLLDNPEEGFDYNKQTYQLEKWAADGQLVYETDLSSLTENTDYFYINYMEVDKDGNVYLADNNQNINVFGTEGDLLCSLSTDNYFAAMGTSKDGDVYIAQWGSGNGQELVKVDPVTKSFGSPLLGIPSNIYDSALIGGMTKDILLRDNSSMYEYDIKTQTSEEILSFIDCDINANYIRYYAPMEDGSVFLYLNDWESMSTDLVVLTKKQASEVTQKEAITLGCMYLDGDIQKNIINFNKTNEKYRITVKDYSKDIGEEEDAYEQAMMRMNNELLTGNGPDLLVLDNVNVNQLAAKGVWEDLNPYLDGSSLIKREELVESVLKAYTAGDVLISIPSSFNISTLLSGQSLVGDEMGWTLDEMIAVVDKMPADTQVMQYITKDNLLSMSLIFNEETYINWSTGECSFDTEEFKQVLEFANRFPAEYNYDEEQPSMPELVREGKLLLNDITLSDIAFYSIYEQIWGEPVTCIGYPSATTNGSSVRGYTALGMNSNSKQKEGAWEFLEYQVAQSSWDDRNSWGLPIKKAELDKLFEDAMTPEYQLDQNGEKMLDENGEPITNSKGGYGWGNSNETFEFFAATQKQVDDIKEVIYNTTTRYNYDTQLMNIIMEEAKPFFLGQKSVDEVTDIIQSRVQIYVNESR